MNTVTKNSIAKNIFYEMGIPTSMALDMVNSIFSLMIDNLAKEKQVKISKFGSFNTKRKAPRIGRNLNTGEKVTIHPRTIVGFSASEQLKKVINAANKNE